MQCWWLVSTIFTWLKFLRVFFHYVVILVTKTVTLTLCLNWLFIVSKENILWFYCNQSIALKNGRNPNVKYTLHGKTFCLNCKVECLKQTSTFDLHFESKYFVNSVADQLNQNSFMKRLLMESWKCSCNHI